MKPRAPLKVLTLLIVWTMVLWIAVGPEIHAQSLSVSVTILSLDQISINDLDFENFHGSRPFIALTMISPGTTKVILHLDIEALLGGESQPFLLATAVSIPFDLTGTMRVTNVDLGSSTGIALNANESGIYEGAGKRVNDVLQTTGKLPYGTYTFKAWLESLTPNVHTSTEFPVSVTIQNPSRVELLAPSTNTDWPNTFPVFQWSSNTDEVILGVYEKQPGMQTPQEAISGVPNLQTRLGKINTFQYPPSGPGVRQLEPGKSYYWFVQGLIRSGSNTEDVIPSEIWQINISRQSGSAASAAILSQLEDIAGPQFAALIQRLQEMGFEPTGLLRFGGVTMTWTEFLQRVRLGEFQITNMTID
jgi:hypothetical protein